MSEFAYATLTPRTTRLHKREIAERHPEFRFAFGAPGLVTWKSPKALGADFRLEGALAQSDGVSLGLARSVDEVVALVRRDPTTGAALLVAPLPTDEDPSEAADPTRADAELRLAPVEAALRGTGLFAEAAPTEGSTVVEVFRLAGEPESYFVGRRVARFFDPRHRSEFTRATLPPNAPSRAYAKAAEGFARFSSPPIEEEHVLELGAAPGGAVLRCLELGLDVTAVDPAELAPSVLDVARERGRSLTIRTQSALDLARGDLPRNVAWLLSDMNLAPQVVVPTIERILGLLRRPPRGALVTLKLNDEKALAALPALERRAARWGAEKVAFRQLPSHRTEVVMFLAFGV